MYTLRHKATGALMPASPRLGRSLALWSPVPGEPGYEAHPRRAYKPVRLLTRAAALRMLDAWASPKLKPAPPPLESMSAQEIESLHAFARWLCSPVMPDNGCLELGPSHYAPSSRRLDELEIVRLP